MAPEYQQPPPSEDQLWEQLEFLLIHHRQECVRVHCANCVRYRELAALLGRAFITEFYPSAIALRAGSA
jgi:hypothetical protein